MKLMNKPVKVALIGLGGWGRTIVEAVKRSKKLKLVSCYSDIKEERINFAEKPVKKTE
ncbi:MAG: hypothetical protein KKH91_06080 [Elusimicrobia bacterium]|nr:hypothetical protein [Elusimicrobiota bacterium]MBU2615209.1 hypothetical protein [Elusimicrobiota bacterium]